MVPTSSKYGSDCSSLEVRVTKITNIPIKYRFTKKARKRKDIMQHSAGVSRGEKARTVGANGEYGSRVIVKLERAEIIFSALRASP